MLRTLNLVKPGLLKEFDRYLLLNHPIVWATRIPNLLFAVICGILLACFSAWWIDLAAVPNVAIRMGLMSIPVIFVFGYWGWSVYHHRVHIQYGNFPFWDRVKYQLVLLGGVVLLASVPVLYGFQLVRHIDKSIATELLAKDIETLYDGAPYFLDEKVLTDLHEFAYHPKFAFLSTDYFVPGITNFGRGNIAPHFSGKTIEQKKNRFQQVYKKYSGVSPDWESTLINLRRIAQAKNKDHILFQSNFAYVFIFLILLAGMAFVVFQEGGMKPFLVAVVLGIIGIVLAALLYLATDFFINVAFGGEYIFLLCGIGFSLWKGFFPTKGKYGKLIQKSFLMISGMSMFIILGTFTFLFGINLSFYREIYYLFIPLASILLWLFVFSPKLQVISASPGKH